MYKHALYFRRLSDDADSREDVAFHKRQWDPARAPEILFVIFKASEIIERIKIHRQEKDYSFVELAHKLNFDGLPDAHGRPWTHISLQAFLQRPNRLP